MKFNNKIILLLIVSALFLIVSLSAVSATTDQVDSFTKLNESISAGHDVELNQTIIATSEEASEFNSGIVIDHDVTIDGKGYSIDANNSMRIFEIKNNAVLTLINITLKNGNAEKGGAIYADGNVTINSDSSVIFTNNVATGGAGGAIFAKNININVKNVEFINNSANYNGGAIYANGNVTIACVSGNITFENNKASGNGGAIYGMNVTIDSFGAVYFNNNTSSGGVVFSNNGMVTITSKNGAVTFENNNGTNGYGGAIYANNVIINSFATVYFNNNTALSGGAIYASMVSITSRNGAIIFENNKVSTNGFGGAIRANANVIIDSFGAVYFINNTALYGGAIYTKTININKIILIFNNNTATNGKNIYITDLENSTIDDCFWGLNYNDPQEIKDDKLICLNNNYIAPEWWLLYNIIAPEEIAANYNNTFKLVLNQRTNGVENESIKAIPANMLVNLTASAGTIKQGVGYFNFTTNQSGDYTVTAYDIYNNEKLTEINFKVGGTSVSNLADLIAKNSTITLDEDYYFYKIIDSNLVRGLQITKDTLINGNGHTIYGQNMLAIFNVAKGAKLTLTNINLVSGKVAIINNGVLSLPTANAFGKVKSNGIIINNGNITSEVLLNIPEMKVSTYDSFIYTLTTKDGIAIYDKNLMLVDNYGVEYPQYIFNNGYYISYVPLASEGFVSFDDTVIPGINNLTIDGGLFVAKEGTFTYLQYLVDNTPVDGVLTLTRNYTSSGNAVLINKDITIDGNGYTLNGNDLSAIFNVLNGDVKLININFVNAAFSAINNYGDVLINNCNFINNEKLSTLMGGSSYGGAIYNNGTMIIEDSVFKNNRASYGGAIYSEAPICVVDSVFVENVAVEGGAIHSLADLTVKSSIFVKNAADGNHGSYVGNGYGGAIYHEIGYLIVIDSKFDSNVAKTYGGAINTYSAPNGTIVKAIIKDSEFVNNYAGVDGGAIMTDTNDNIAAVINITDSYFANNGLSKEKGVNAGAVYLYMVRNSTIANCNFVNNYATKNGGALYIQGSNVKVINSKFINNSAEELGGAVLILSSSNIDIADSNFENNNATEGGAIYTLTGRDVYIYDSFFYKNSAKLGGAINNNLSGTYIMHCIFENNFAFDDGGAIYNAKPSEIAKNYFKSNVALDHGGAIENNGTFSLIMYNHFVSNVGSNYSGAIANYKGNISLINNTIDEKVILNSGFIDSIVNIIILNDTTLVNIPVVLKAGLFDDNGNFIYDYRGLNFYVNGEEHIGTFDDPALFFPTKGGEYPVTAIYKYANITNQVMIPGVITVNNFIPDTFNELQYLVDNTVEGGILTLNKDYYSIGKSVEITKDIIIDGNGYTLDAKSLSAIFLIHENTTVVLKNITFINALYGAIINNGHLTVISSNFTDNRNKGFAMGGQGHGGAIYSDGILIVKNSMFYDNNAVYGGAIYNDNIAIIQNSIFENNDATEGGAIYNNGDLTVSYSIFANNTADGHYGSTAVHRGYGGAIYHQNGELIVDNSSFIGNYARTYGGAINIFNKENLDIPTVKINNSHFAFNYAGIDGGAIMTDCNNISVSAIVDIVNCEFAHNYLTEDRGVNAGAVYLFMAANSTVINNTFYDNYATKNGGALYIQGSNIEVISSKFLNNKANESAGAVFVLDSVNVLFNNCIFENNHAYVGGAVYLLPLTKGFVIIKDCEFLKNSAESAGAIVNYMNNTHIENSFFGFNTAIDYGGAIDNINASIVVYNNTFNSNYAYYGGALSNNNGFAFIQLNTFIDNVGEEYSGAIDNFNGIMYLEDNDVSGINIYNKGFILSEVNIKVLNNETVNPGESVILKAYVYDDNGNVIYNPQGIIFDVNGTLINSTLKNPGMFSTNESGYYVVSVNYPYSNATLQSIEKGYVIVADQYNLDVEDVVKYYNSDKSLVAILTKNGEVLAGETIAFTINNRTYYRVTDENGVASIAINLNPDNYVVEVSYGNITKYAGVVVLSTIEAQDVVKMFHNDTQYAAYFTDSEGNALINKEVYFNINGVIYTRTTDSDGIARLNINLFAGNYILTAYNPVTNQYFSNNIIVLPTIVGEDLTKIKGSSDQYEVTVYDEQGNLLVDTDITLNINGVLYHRITDSNGVARLNINLDVGEYIITASYGGFVTSNKIVVVDV